MLRLTRPMIILSVAAASPLAMAQSLSAGKLHAAGAERPMQHVGARDHGETVALQPFAATLSSRAASPDDGFELELSGRLHAESTWHRGDDGPAKAIDGTQLRRGRIGVNGRVSSTLSFTGEIELADMDAPLRDFWVRYDGWDGIGITVGHQKQPYSLALEMSSNDLPFVERGIDNALNAPFVDRASGVRVDASRGRWFAAAGVYGERADRSGDGWGTSARFVYAPVSRDDKVLHLGLRSAYREPRGDRKVRIRDETTDSSSLHVVDTAELPGARRVLLLGPEAALAIGPFSVQGEYTRASIDSDLGALDFSGWHVAATWTLGGESRARSYALGSGEFKGLKPAHDFFRSGGGTWELAARYAALDLNNGPLVGGTEERLTLGANWYADRNFRVLLDWTQVLDTDGSNALRRAVKGLDVFTLRAQYVF
jgi:phosphate-selective porin OprO and OprP